MSRPDRLHIFLSDVHLGSAAPAHEKELADDLTDLIDFSIRNGAALYILGDLFDYWMEYPKKNFIPPLGTAVLDAFEEYNKAIQPALYITGNHDNWTFGHFRERGFDVESEYRIVSADSHNILLMHGDGLYHSGGRLRRPLMHRIIRHPAFVKSFQAVLPPKIGLGVMRFFSNATRKRQQHRPDILNNHAEKILNSPDFDILITGHDHLAREIPFSGGTYYNTGAFFKNRSMIIYNKSAFQLVKWQASAKEFVSLSQTIPAE